MNKHYEKRKVRATKAVRPKIGLLGWLWKRLGSDLDGNELLHLLLRRSEETYRSSWSLNQKADWKNTGKIKWSVVINFELNEALWILSSVQMQAGSRRWFALFFLWRKLTLEQPLVFSQGFHLGDVGVPGLGECLQPELGIWPHRTVVHPINLSFLLPSFPWPKRHFCMWREKQLWWVGESRAAGGLVSCLGDERLNLEILLQFRQSKDDLHGDPLVWWLPE